MIYDITVEGSAGLYEIFTPTTRGKRWVKKHVEPNAQRTEGGIIICEGGDNIRAIVAAAVRAKLRVEVNGLDMKGFRAA